MPVSEAFKQAQDRWCEGLISDVSLCDAVAFVGPERHRVPFLRPHLARTSTPLKAALYGEFREGCTRELVLEDVSVEAFDVMLRSAYHLDPKLTPKRALEGLKAAKVYMIEDLEKFCWHYLHDLEGLDCTLILQTLTESVKLSFELPEELQHTYWTNILAKSAAIVQSPFFVETHGSVISKLVKLDEFQVKEETLWDRLVEWSAHAVRNPELLGPFAAATPCEPQKRAKTEADDSNALGPSERAQQEAVLSLISPHMRFVQMEKDFFVDKVRAHLERREIDAVTDFFLLGRASQGLLRSKRAGLSDTVEPAEQVQSFAEVSGFRQKKIKLYRPTSVTKVEVSFTGRFKPYAVVHPEWSVSIGQMKFENTKHEGLVSTIAMNLREACDELVIHMSVDFLEKVGSIKVFGKHFKKPVEIADQVVKRLAKDLVAKPEHTKTDADQG